MRVVIIDDDKLVVSSLKSILETDIEIQVSGIGYSGADAVKLYKQYQPDILLMDIRMEGMSGLETSQEILKENHDAKILLLTTFSDDEYIIKALNMGVKGYLIKQDFESIIPALKAVHSGQNVFGSDVISRLCGIVKEEKKDSEKSGVLSEKELGIMELVAKGFNNKEIAETLFLSEGTVRNYISTILDKLELRDRTQLAIYYLT